jgi:spermidine synthase
VHGFDTLAASYRASPRVISSEVVPMTKSVAIGLRQFGLYVLFFASGGSALVYQVVWQRSLFALFGIHLAAVTLVVTAFMIGLGVGSLFGGWLSKHERAAPLAVFSALELGIGSFGLVSLPLFSFAGDRFALAPDLLAGTVVLGLLLVPTTMMGATLPLLVTHLVRRAWGVGKSVGALYFVNTLGSAAASFVTALWLLAALGQRHTVWLAAAVNLTVGVTMALLARWDREP